MVKLKELVKEICLAVVILSIPLIVTFWFSIAAFYIVCAVYIIAGLSYIIKEKKLLGKALHWVCWNWGMIIVVMAIAWFVFGIALMFAPESWQEAGELFRACLSGFCIGATIAWGLFYHKFWRHGRCY